jgi:hypothetical protein
MAYAAYLRVYEPVSAFHGPDRSRWTAYRSAAGIRAALDGAGRDECEFAVAMYRRARNRWRAFAEFERAN